MLRCGVCGELLPSAPKAPHGAVVRPVGGGPLSVRVMCMENGRIDSPMPVCEMCCDEMQAAMIELAQRLLHRQPEYEKHLTAEAWLQFTVDALDAARSTAEAKG